MRSRQLAAHRRRIAALGREAHRARVIDLAHGVSRRRTDQKRREHETQRDWLHSLTQKPSVGVAVASPTRSRGAGRPAAARRRAGSSSSTSSSDPGGEDGEPEPPARRLCACGCGRDISRKRAGARTFGPSCRKRLSRSDGALAGPRPAPASVVDAAQAEPRWGPTVSPAEEARIEAIERSFNELRRLMTSEPAPLEGRVLA